MDWQLDQRCEWTRVNFHITNILLSKSCVWLLILKFLSTDPFAAALDGRTTHEIPLLYEYFGTAIIILWFIIVIAYMFVNMLILLIMVYHFYRKVLKQSIYKLKKFKKAFAMNFFHHFFYRRKKKYRGTQT